MNSKLINRYSILVDFLGKVLESDYEIALHEINLEKQTLALVNISNGQVSGRKVGAPVTGLALKMIKDKVYEKHNYILNYKGISNSGKELRCSTIFIKDDDGTLIGMLCINFDDSRYLELSRQVISLCQSNILGQETNEDLIGTDVLPDTVESFPHTIDEVIDDTMRSIPESNGVAPERLTPSEKIRIVDILNQRGIFLLKGSVSEVSKKLCCSEPTIYRYLNSLNENKN